MSRSASAQMSAPTTPLKMAACDPCRFAKLGCDHVRPICGRCQSKGNAVVCEYRTRPFKKQKIVAGPVPSLRTSQRQRQVSTSPGPVQVMAMPTTRQYPNPGYLGSSSHTTIFQNFSPAADIESPSHGSQPTDREPPIFALKDDQLVPAMKLIQDICLNMNVPSCVALVESWTRHSGVNLPLAAGFVIICAQSVESALNRCHASSDDEVSRLAQDIFHNSCRPLIIDQSPTMDSFVASFGQANVRWETIGLFLTAVSRASIDVQTFPPHFASAQQLVSLRRLALRYADRCLEISLSLDYLNDVQLVFQYENFINHSFVDGDQSYHSWKRLGDVISSIFALGYHEKISTGDVCPHFLVNLRQSVVARAYSADKNVSIFLGRPPRMIRKYCSFDWLDTPSTSSEANDPPQPYYLGWSLEHDFDYVLDTWWSFICALLKEEVLDLSLEKDVAQRLARASGMMDQAQARWSNLPSKYRYSGDLKLQHYKSIERDFVASARLNYLHTLFLLRQSLVPNIAEPDAELLSICEEILDLTAKVAVMKGRLTNSGTGLIWKICHYGLPAAGVICLSLLHNSSAAQTSLPSRSRSIQDLSVLVAHVDSGVLIDPSDPDYALLAAATRAIQTILDKILTQDELRAAPARLHRDLDDTCTSGVTDAWIPWSTSETWDFEVDFWTTLVEHPILNAGDLAA